MPQPFRTSLQMVAGPARGAEWTGQRTHSEIVHCENKLRVLHYVPSVPERFSTPLVMTAPLVYPHYIMDLRPGKSLVEYLLARGLDVFMIDWGTPTDADRFDTLDVYVVRYLKHAVEAICRLTRQSRVTLHGYCQGGLLAVLFTALFPERVRSLVSQTGPVDFRDGGFFSLWSRALNVDLLVDTLGNIPAEMLWSVFQMVNPTGALERALRFYERLEDEVFVRDYLAMNAWLNDVIPLPGEFFRRFIKDLYQRNLLVQGELDIVGTRIDLHRITCPVLTITSEKDAIVPFQSAAPLHDLVGSADKRLLCLRGGHLGMTVGREASRELWPALGDWIVERSERNA
jgi:polyhydroxyalkanoate synthase